MKTRLTELLGIEVPIIQAPMAGVSTPALAAAVSNAGGLGSIAVGAGSAEAATRAMRATRAATNRAFAVNLFVHPAPARDPAREAAWLDTLAPLFAEFGAAPPAELAEIYRSFNNDDAMLDALLADRPPVVSFHFGLPDADRVAALKTAGAVLLASATTPEEAVQAAAAGIDAVVAQG
ncbi:MAG: nitronate monooxygenase, partial [Inquilinus sp.]|nr:nitronate monooxygenase [Inquilinus sp.]